MGFFDKVKQTLGISAGTLEIKVQPEGLHVGGAMEGVLTFKALKDVDVFRLELDLVHSFPEVHFDGYSEQEVIHEEVVESMTLAERIHVKAQDAVDQSFMINLPPQVAASIGKFTYRLDARAVLKGAGDVNHTMPVRVRLSPITDAVYRVITTQFGFTFSETGADEDGIWLSFEPTPPVRKHFGTLTIAFDEQPDTLYLWVQLDGVREDVLKRHFARSHDMSDGSVKFEINKGRYAAGGKADLDGIFGLLKPLFTI